MASFIRERINAFTPTEARPYFVLGLPTGSSPEGIYKLLVADHKAGKLSFRNVVTFNMVLSNLSYVLCPIFRNQILSCFFFLRRISSSKPHCMTCSFFTSLMPLSPLFPPAP